MGCWPAPGRSLCTLGCAQRGSWSSFATRCCCLLMHLLACLPCPSLSHLLAASSLTLSLHKDRHLQAHEICNVQLLLQAVNCRLFVALRAWVDWRWQRVLDMHEQRHLLCALLLRKHARAAATTRRTFPPSPSSVASLGGLALAARGGHARGQAPAVDFASQASEQLQGRVTANN